MSIRDKLLIIVAILAVLVWFGGELVLSRAAMALIANSDPASADVIVALRGDDAAFSRNRRAAALHVAGYAERIYVSSALDDLSSKILEAEGLTIPSHVRLISMLYQQRGVPCQSILIDHSQPGGGTRGEMRRIRRMMETLKLHSVLIVTSWYHTARTEQLARVELGSTDIKFRVLQAEDSAPIDRWWHDRYLALVVATEWGKTLIDWLGGIQFENDTGHSDRHPSISSSCSVSLQDSR